MEDYSTPSQSQRVVGVDRQVCHIPLHSFPFVLAIHRFCCRVLVGLAEFWLADVGMCEDGVRGGGVIRCEVLP